jgi:predicted nucleotidyltransferase
MINENLKKDLINNILKINPEKIIIFGSFSNETENMESDLDLYVVTKDLFVPENWHEKNDLYLKVSRTLRKIRTNIPIDLIVHTKSMYEEALKNKGSFVNHVLETGKVIYG